MSDERPRNGADAGEDRDRRTAPQESRGGRSQQPQQPPRDQKQSPSVLRSLGAFVGHLWAGVTADPKQPLPPRLQDDAERDRNRQGQGQGQERRRVMPVETHEKVREGVVDGRRVILRETVTREIEFADDGNDASAEAGPRRSPDRGRT